MWYEASELVELIDALATSPVKERETFYASLSDCRPRRVTSSHRQLPVQQVFTHADAEVLREDAALGRRLRVALREKLPAGKQQHGAATEAELLAPLVRAMEALDEKRSGWIDVALLRQIFTSADGGLSSADADALVVMLGRALDASGALHATPPALKKKERTPADRASSVANFPHAQACCRVHARTSTKRAHTVPPLLLTHSLASLPVSPRQPDASPLPPLPPMMPASPPAEMMKKAATLTIIDLSHGKRLVKVSAVVGNLARILKA